MSNNNLSIPKSIPKEPSDQIPSNTTHQKNPKSPNNHQDPQQQKALKCPRCNSPNTKFCYYNNYSLSQPRHFCKTCRRYWTRGGALRNVPVGGGCRKTKKSLKSCNSPNNPITTAPCSSSASRFFMEDSRFFNGLLVSNSQLYPSLYDEENNNNNLQLPSSSSSFGDPNCGSNLSLMGFNNFSIPNSGPVGTVDNIASSIETLSSLNQDLHLKLQQQRMAMIFGDQNPKENINGPDRSVKPQPILFQNLETDSSRKEGLGDATAAAAAGTEWLFGNSMYGSGASNVNNVPNHWNGTQAWNDLNQF